jgi:peptide/nickel transport system permease protein
VGKYILRRILIMIPLLFAISIVTFTFINLAPGDPVTAMISPDQQLQAGDLEKMREYYGLNEPAPVRYVIWLREALTGNLGYSYMTREPVLDRILARVPPTLELMGAALLISTLLGTTLGVLAALKAYSFWDYLLSIFSLVGLSIPGFFFALIVLYLFAARIPIMPPFGMSSRSGDTPALLDNLHHLILPATVLSLELTASLTRYSRSAMLDVMRTDYVTTARSKGLSEFRVISRHAFRNALLPLITIVSLRLPLLLGGAIVIESMFQWPGMGLLALAAIEQRDYPVLMGLTFITATLVLFGNLIADILYGLADPRIRIG